MSESKVKQETKGGEDKDGGKTAPATTIGGSNQQGGTNTTRDDCSDLTDNVNDGNDEQAPKTFPQKVSTV